MTEPSYLTFNAERAALLAIEKAFESFITNQPPSQLEGQALLIACDNDSLLLLTPPTFPFVGSRSEQWDACDDGFVKSRRWKLLAGDFEATSMFEIPLKT